MSHVLTYLHEVEEIAANLDHARIESMAQWLNAIRTREARLWIAGLGGSAANASHAASDFRRLCMIEAYSLTESIAGLTAAANDEGWDRCLTPSMAKPHDGLLILSVGGGTHEVSKPIVRLIDEAIDFNFSILAIVGRDGGYAAKKADVSIIVPTVNEKHVTPHTEAFQMVILHCLVSHPLLQKRPTKW